MILLTATEKMPNMSNCAGGATDFGLQQQLRARCLHRTDRPLAISEANLGRTIPVRLALTVAQIPDHVAV